MPDIGLMICTRKWVTSLILFCKEENTRNLLIELDRRRLRVDVTSVFLIEERLTSGLHFLTVLCKKT